MYGRNATVMERVALRSGLHARSHSRFCPKDEIYHAVFSFGKSKRFTICSGFVHSNFSQTAFNKLVMRKNTTILMLCALVLLADSICIKQTIEMRETLGTAFLVSMMIAQIVSAFAVSFLALLVFRKSHARQKKPDRRRSAFALFQPLRRLFVSVWS